MATTVYRKDYRAPSHWVDTVKLEFDLDPESTGVTSTMHVRPNQELENPDYDLVLDGEDLTLVSVSIDDTPLPEADYVLEKDKLVLKNITTECDVRIVNRFSPAANSKLSGIYVSGENLMSQCESEGFRRITYFPDRPDVLARYTVVIRAEKERYPVLLSNGNPGPAEDLGDGRHEIVWSDPYPKPSYLFALVAGRLECERELFELKDGRKVTLEVWVEPRDIDKTHHTMESLKKAIRWDEERFGLELDLDGFRIVATQDFNFGAMENKGLNIFNARYVLANPKVATDRDYFNIESVVGHEYFHNWTGDRVTLRDWFQLTLKEGLTVFRDQEFSSDMLGEATARAVERIRNVIVMRNAQFREDGGPMAHPIRPESYQQVDNFYTVTVYEKGAEVIRMLHTMLGEETFRRGFDLYIEKNDGKAVTCEDFLAAMEEASGRDLEQFRLWYSQAGTPRVTVTPLWNDQKKQLVLTVTQNTPATPGQPVKRPFLMPFPIAFIDPLDGAEVPVKLASETETPEPGIRHFELSQAQHVWVFDGLAREPVLSLNAGFAAPVIMEYNVSETPEEGQPGPTKKERFLSVLSLFAKDPFVRWDSINRLMLHAAHELIARKPHEEDRNNPINRTLVQVFETLINDPDVAPAYKAICMTLPTENAIAETLPLIDPVAVRRARDKIRFELGTRYAKTLNELVDANRTEGEYSPDPVSAGRRSLVEACLDYLTAANDKHGLLTLRELAEKSNNLTDRLTGLTYINRTRIQPKNELIRAALEEWFNEPLLMNKWYSIVASAPSFPGDTPVVERVNELMHCGFFNMKNPNQVLALLGTFFLNNPAEFHGSNGYGYSLWCTSVVELDKLNPHTSARMARALENWRRYAPEYARQMYAALSYLHDKRDELSTGVNEIVEKALNNPL